MEAHNMRTWWRYSLAVMLLMSIVVGTVGAENARAHEFAEKALRPGSWSLQFGIVRDFQLGSFDGMLLSCKKHFSSKRAMRIGISIGASLRDTDSDEHALRYFDEHRAEGEDQYSMSASVTGLYLLYPSGRNRANLYLGVGPTLNYSREKSEQEATGNHLGCCDEQWSYGYSIGAGGRGVLGIEWLASENIGIQAEYAVSLMYTYASSETSRFRDRYVDETFTSESISRSLNLSSNHVRFGMSVYF